MIVIFVTVDTEQLTAVLFSGGKGSRLFPISEFYQKVMMPVGEKGTPLLEIVIEHLKYYNITNFVTLIGYKGNQIKHYFGDGSRFDVHIKYSFDDPLLKGTGGALLNAKQLITTQDILVYYTDVLTNFDFKKFYQFHRENQKIGTIWLDSDWKEAEFIIHSDAENNAVTNASSLSDSGLYVNTGISLLNTDVFDLLQSIEQSINQRNKSIDLSHNAFPNLVKNKELAGYIDDSWWLDVGTVARHSLLTQNYLEEKLPHLVERGVI